MNNITLKVVETKADEQAFLDLPRSLYSGDPNWTCGLDMEVRNTFNPAKNAYFQHGEAIRWLALDGTGKVVGRIAAFVDYHKASKFERPTGGIGFFECENDQALAFRLFDTARDWLKTKGMQAMNGPINFGENHVNWGLLVNGYTPTSYGLNYNKPYYRDFFEAYGFKVFFQQISKELDITKPMPERFLKIHEWVMGKGNIRIAYAQPDTIYSYGKDFMTIYNAAWEHHDNFSPIKEENLKKMIDELKQVYVPELFIFAYVNDEPAGFIIAIPDLNQIFTPLRGKLNYWTALQFLWRKRNKYAWYRSRGILTRARVLLMGVHPKFQKYGLESAMVMAPMDDVRRLGFRTIELGWVGDFNPNMRAIQEATGAGEKHTHNTYRFVFDQPDHHDYHRTIQMDHREKAIKPD